MKETKLRFYKNYFAVATKNYCSIKTKEMVKSKTFYPLLFFKIT